MLEIKNLDEVRGNNVIIYSIKSLLEKHSFPKFSIMAGHMGVGKSTVANLVANELNEFEYPVQVYNFGMEINMNDLEDAVFKRNPSVVRAFVFEEMQGMDKAQQTALLSMLDKQPSNVYIIGTTTEIYKIQKTIRSRATVWDFKLLGERQLAQLLDDYLKDKPNNLSQRAKNTLLKSCHGVPRDLLRNVDLAISGDFTADQLDALLGHVSEDLVFALLCSLKSASLDFSTNMSQLMEESSRDKLVQLRDFFTRYMLERKGIPNATISKDKIEMLDSLFTQKEIYRIGTVLAKANADNIMLELSLLNMELTGVNSKHMVGQQVDRRAQNLPASAAVALEDEGTKKIQSAKITPESLKKLKLQ